MLLILVTAALALCVSFCCSLFEAALYAITPAEVEVLRAQRAFGARRIARFRAKIEEPIAAILTVNTVANTLGSALCGAMVVRQYDDYALGVFTAAFTLSVLVVSEIVPKSLGVHFAPVLAPWIAWPLQWMIWISWPIARASRALMHLMTRFAPDRSPGSDEILIMSRMARKGGALRPQELRWVENALHLDRITAKDIMTPRTVVDALAADLRIGDLAETKTPWVHTRLPIIEDGDPDKIVGVVHGKDVFRALLEGRADETLRDLAHEIAFVPEGMRGDHLLDKFIAERKHMVAVADEYGGFEGIVTLEDVLECLLGSEIVDEHDRHADLQVVARRQAEERAQRLEG